MKLTSSSLLLIVVAAACDSAPNVAAPRTQERSAQLGLASTVDTGDYHLTDIGAGIPGRRTGTHAVNASGVVFGRDATNPAGERYFSWQQSTGVVYPTLLSGAPFFPDAINDRGDILGESPLGDPQPWMHWADGHWEHITLPVAKPVWTAGQAINKHGTWTGVYQASDEPNQVTFLWSSTRGYVRIQGACEIVPFGMNDRDQVVGYARTTCSGPLNIFSWTPDGGFRNLGTFGGMSAIALSVNVHGVIAANINYGDHSAGVLISPSLIATPLPNPLGGLTTRANHVNDAGDVVGAIQGLSGLLLPVIWDVNKRATLLPTPVDRGSATTMSSNGLIVGQGRGADGFAHALFWSPTSPADLVRQAATRVEELEAAGSITPEVELTLRAPLDAAALRISHGQPRAAVHILTDYSELVDHAIRAGLLTPPIGDYLKHKTALAATRLTAADRDTGDDESGSNN